MARKFKDDSATVNKLFQEFVSGIDLQPHQEAFCEAEQKIVFFGGK